MSDNILELRGVKTHFALHKGFIGAGAPGASAPSTA